MKGIVYYKRLNPVLIHKGQIIYCDKIDYDKNVCYGILNGKYVSLDIDEINKMMLSYYSHFNI